jgi:glycosyltransferase involved in cell wall biosynthesis
VINIIVVVINDKSGLDRTLRSIYDQNISGDSYRVVIIDGFSGDGTYDLAKSISRTQDFVLQSPPYGIYDAMNIGLQHVFQYPDDDAVIFLNAGDFFFSRESLRLLQMGLSNHEQIAGLSAFLDIEGGFEVSVPKIDLASMSSPVRLWIPHQAFCATVSTYKTVGLMDVRLKIAGDIDWFVRASLICGTPQILNEVISVQMVGGRSRIKSYSGYLERIDIAKSRSLQIDRYSAKLLIRVYLSEKLGRRLPKILRQKMPHSLEFEAPTIKRFMTLSSASIATNPIIQPED